MMDARRVRILVAAILSVGLVSPLLVGTVAAAACTLSAPASVAIGTPLTIVGSGFPVSSTVDVSLTIEGGSPDRFTVPADASGAFEISLTPESADAGETTVVATSGPDCTAEVVFTAGSGATVPTETGAEAEAGAAAAPRTDADTGRPDGTPGTPNPAWLVAGLLLGLGLGGLFASRPARSR